MTRSILLAATFACAVPFVVPAFAAEAVITAPATAVILPWGDWIVAAGQTLTSVLVPALVTLLMGVVYQLFPLARLFLTEALARRIIQYAVDYALNAVAGAVKGRTLDLNTGSVVIAKGTQRVIDQVPGFMLNALGGPEGVAEKIFRVLHLEDAATAANTLAPAIGAIRPAKG